MVSGEWQRVLQAEGQVRRLPFREAAAYGGGVKES